LSRVAIESNAEELLLAVKMGKDTATLLERMHSFTLKELLDELDNDNKKKAFWINCYNAFYQILRKELKLPKEKIYFEKVIQIAGQEFSLDEIEHGILRRYKFKYALGFISNPFAPTRIKQLAVNDLDYRIHFALNCGAKSCPPIAFYKSADLDYQLDTATQSFLEGETKYDDANKELHTTALFQWFRFDFGGTKGIREIYKKQMDKDVSGYTIKYNKYSWDELLDNYSDN